MLQPQAPYAALVEAGKRMTVGDRVALLYVLTDSPPASDAARTIVNEIRAHRLVGDGELVVGGQTAGDVDATAFIMARIPYAIAFVVVRNAGRAVPAVRLGASCRSRQW